MRKILLAYSGGLDTSAIIPWLKETYSADVVAFCCNLGNQPDEGILRSQAMELGASDFIFEDVRDEFAENYISPLLRSGATYFDDYLLGTAIARPLIAQRTGFWARKLAADFLAHGATGKGNDHLRFERGWAYLNPEIPVIAPWKIWSFTGRQDLVQYLESKGMAWRSAEKRYSIDINLLHRSCEGGMLERLGQSYEPEEVLGLVRASAVRDATALSLHFQAGRLVAVNDRSLGFSRMLEMLNEIGGRHGIGVVDLVEERTNGLKSRGVYETPGGTIIFHALKELRRLCWSRELYFLGQTMACEYGRYVYDGLWFSDARIGLEKFFESAAENLSGSIDLRIGAGAMVCTKRASPNSLYDMDQTTFEADVSGYNGAAIGYSKFLTDPLRKQGVLAKRS